MVDWRRTVAWSWPGLHAHALDGLLAFECGGAWFVCITRECLHKWKAERRTYDDIAPEQRSSMELATIAGGSHVRHL